MKNFLNSFLGSLAALWVSVAIAGFLGILMLVVAVAGAAGSDTIEVRDDSVLLLDLNGTVTDRQQPIDIMSRLTGQIDQKFLPLNQILASLRHASDDDKIKGLFIKADGAAMGLLRPKPSLRPWPTSNRRANG